MTDFQCSLKEKETGFPRELIVQEKCIIILIFGFTNSGHLLEYGRLD